MSMTADEAEMIKPYWASVVRELDGRIEGDMKSLLHAGNMERVQYHQNRINAFEELKRLPDTVLEKRTGNKA